MGFGGSSAGTSTGYHSYANDPSGIILDSCLSGTDVAAFPNCASTNAQSDIAAGLAQIQAGIATLDADLIQEGINTITVDALNLYQDECGGLAGSGTDGEFEYGTLAAALNVRTGPGAGNNGDGVDVCIGERATAHHGGDTTVFVADLLLDAPEFHVSGDWARTSGQSDDNTNLNSIDERPEISHCGDGTIEPCHADADPGYVNQLVTYGGATGLAADVGETVGEVTTLDLVAALDTVFGCNPLDCNTDIDAGVGSWDSGGPLSDYCGGAAAGWLLVTIGTEVIPETLTLPTGTVGWVWTGTDASAGPPRCGGGIASIDVDWGKNVLPPTVQATAGVPGVACVGASAGDPHGIAGACRFLPLGDGYNYTCTGVGAAVPAGPQLCTDPTDLWVGAVTYRSNNSSIGVPTAADLVTTNGGQCAL